MQSASRIEQALALIAAEEIDAALLDLNLGRHATSLHAAEALAARGIPYAYMTGDGGDSIPPADRSRPRLLKPFAGKDLEAVVAALLNG